MTAALFALSRGDPRENETNMRHPHMTSKHAALANSFPMMCVLINMTLHGLFALRSGALIPMCNQEKNVMAALNQVRVVVLSMYL